MALSNSRVSVRYGRGDWPGVSSTKLFTEHLRPVASHETAAQLGDDASISDLLLQPLLYDSTDDAWRLWFGVETLERRQRDRAYPSYDLTLLAASLGHGIAMVRWPYGSHYIKELDLKFLSPRTVENPDAFHIVTSHRQTTEAVDRLILRMRRIISEHA